MIFQKVGNNTSLQNMGSFFLADIGKVELGTWNLFWSSSEIPRSFSAKVLLHPHSHTRNYLDTSIESFSFDSQSWVGTLWLFQISRKVLPEEFPNRWDQMGLKMLIQKTMPPLPLAKQLHCEAKRTALFSGCAETRRECRRYGGIVGIHPAPPCSPLQFRFFKTESFESDCIDLNDWTSIESTNPQSLEVLRKASIGEWLRGCRGRLQRSSAVS